jgi:hypothetical protein
MREDREVENLCLREASGPLEHAKLEDAILCTELESMEC